MSPVLYAQQIMSYENYQQMRHDEPYVYRIQLDKGELLYFGSRHSFDPGDPQFDELRERFTAFVPEVIYTEGYPEEVDSLSMDEAARRFGEFGVTWKLAATAKIPVHSLEPDRNSEVVHLREAGWSDVQIILFYTLRQVAQSHKQQADIDLHALLPGYLASLEQRFGLNGPRTLPEFGQAVRKHLPDVERWEEVPSYYFYPGPQDPERFTNRIATDSNQFRDRRHAALIAGAVAEGRRVFTIAGSAHAVMQEPALRALLDGQQ